MPMFDDLDNNPELFEKTSYGYRQKYSIVIIKEIDGTEIIKLYDIDTKKLHKEFRNGKLFREFDDGKLIKEFKIGGE